MHPAGAIVIFVLVWWCAFFAMLPIGVTSRWEAEESDGVDGADPGAPAAPNLKKKALWATMAAVPIASAIIAIILSGVINFRE
jgi:predicted secreted protein